MNRTVLILVVHETLRSEKITIIHIKIISLILSLSRTDLHCLYGTK